METYVTIILIIFGSLLFFAILCPIIIHSINDKKEKERKRIEEEKRKERKRREEEERKERKRKKEEHQQKLNTFREQYFNPIIKNLTEEEKEQLIKYCNKTSNRKLVFQCDSLKQYQKLINNKSFLLQELWDIGYGKILLNQHVGLSIWKEIFLNVHNQFLLEFSDEKDYNEFVKWEKENNIYFPLYLNKIFIEYSSPQGRNHYKEEIDITIEELEESFKIYEEKQEQINQNIKLNKYGISQSQCDKERKKLSPKLRFEVFKRDNYKCRICGKSQSDGVQLHCDHIIPIAKGGKTEINNLQTLCQDCNLGKGSQDM